MKYTITSDKSGRGFLIEVEDFDSNVVHFKISFVGGVKNGSMSDVKLLMEGSVESNGYSNLNFCRTNDSFHFSDGVDEYILFTKSMKYALNKAHELMTEKGSDVTWKRWDVDTPTITIRQVD